MIHPRYPLSLGATRTTDGKCQFRVWAPRVSALELKLFDPHEQSLPMQPRPHGYFELALEGIAPGTRYCFRIDGQRDRPDPASRFQPDGVHHPSAVVDASYPWTDHGWHGIPLQDYVTYELHVGTFSHAGTFAGVIEHLDELCDLGITAIELMPVAQFPGARNWGYDGVHPFAVQNTYGGPQELKRLVEAAHLRGLAVVMDVVYNHLGPEGNYLGEFGDYFTDRHQTPWGQAINFGERGSDEVRRFFIENALMWITEYHIDALRLDAVHAIFDFTAKPFLQDLAEAVSTEGSRLNRQVFTIAESSLNDARLVTPVAAGGVGVNGQWNDDLHHALRVVLTGERNGYYEDFRGFPDLVKAFQDGFVLDGRYSEYRGRRHGNSARLVDPIRFVVCAQNHDQVGNRMLGERLPELVHFEQLKLAAAVVLLSPYQPLLFMGEEYAETARFQYFISHLDPGLIDAVRRGRAEEFAQFQWSDAPPDPQDETTFLRCRLNHELGREGRHRTLREFYKALLGLRKNEAAFRFPDRDRSEVRELPPAQAMSSRCWTSTDGCCSLFHAGAEPTTVTLRLPAGAWDKVLDSADPCWDGPQSSLPGRIESPGEVKLTLPPYTAAVYKTTFT